jgi:hypothetical protein
MGGIAAVFVVPGISVGSQFAGIGITIMLALITGYIVGRILLALGRKRKPYSDEAEIIETNVDEETSTL